MEKPLVVVIDEVDRLILDTIISGDTIPSSKYGKQEWYDKSSWCKYFDKFHSRGLQGVIMIMTMNSSIEKYDAADSSLLRGGRVDLCINMTTSVHDLFMPRKIITIA